MFDANKYLIRHIEIKLARNLRKETGINNICLAGGVALNCVANGKLLREKIFDEIWIQPAVTRNGRKNLTWHFFRSLAGCCAPPPKIKQMIRKKLRSIRPSEL